MSRVGKKPIIIPGGVKADLKEKRLLITGPKGELSFEVPSSINTEIKEDKILFSPDFKAEGRKLTSGQKKKINALWGMARNHTANLIQGVVSGYEKALEFEGLGYKVQVENNDLVLYVGFSHALRVNKIPGIDFSVEKNVIRVSGIDKQLVGQTASKIRKLRIPDAYKGKGIRYFGEILKKKAGKKAAATTTK